MTKSAVELTCFPPGYLPSV